MLKLLLSIVSNSATIPSFIELESIIAFNRREVMGEILMTKGRKKIALEGSRLISEALKAGFTLSHLFVTTEFSEQVVQRLTVENRNGPNNEFKLYTVASKQMNIWSSVVTPPGVIGNLITIFFLRNYKSWCFIIIKA